jgi:hypothetical protein
MSICILVGWVMPGPFVMNELAPDISPCRRNATILAVPVDHSFDKTVPVNAGDQGL